MSKFVDITGNRYGKLTVIERLDNTDNGGTVWKCKCDCGNYTDVRGGNLRSGGVKSCGCLRRINLHGRTHNMSKTRIYKEWAGIKSRCYTPSNPCYFRYGGRGIKVCDEWRNSFETFKSWAYNNGYNDTLTIERIDNDGDYSPENCTWITWEEQAKNKRSNRVFTYKGKTQDLTDWCKELGVEYKRVHNRINKLGWNFEKAITVPCNVNKRNRRSKSERVWEE